MEKDRALIVLADDDPDVLWVLGDALETAGFHVLAVDHPDLVEDIVVGACPALVVLDLLLPQLTGIDLARRLHQGGFTSTPLIAISAHDSLLCAARSSGLFRDVLGKPFDLSVLLGSVEEATSSGSVHH